MKYRADYLELGKIPELTHEYRDFQILSLTADTAALARLRLDNPGVETFGIVNLQSHAKASALALQGMPSCMLVDRQGYIVRMDNLGTLLDERGMIDKIREIALR